jgi:hypothetical protein
LLISSRVGAGKTEIVKQYSKVRGIKLISEPTAFGIKKEHLDAIAEGEIKHIIIGDLLMPLSKHKKTREDFIAFWNTMMEEGISSIATYAQSWNGDKDVKCGLITTIAESDLLRKSRRWFEMGFLSRAIPLTYSYTSKTKVKIYTHIAGAGDISELPKKRMWLPPRMVKIRQARSLNLKLIEISMGIEKWEKVYGFRRQEQLQTLMMANALKNKRHRVLEEDYDKIMELSEFINLDFKEI